ncbi:ferritin-like protein [Chromobacterium violaceum]|uniref:ferritin-like protein n=1 Tax=Chromobacterium violaceum TaxID=536 RepID=UPI001C8B9ED7|nr:ferritin-like protein [Chromobacterium violaceum]MBX9268029.1 ferritin-like protein [Chromobacterium violaceum]
MSIDSSKPFGMLFDRIYGQRAAEDLADARKPLQDAAQLAIQVEMTTIPPYLTALYSISDPNCEAYQLLRSVMMEEMFHINQAANLLVAIGGRPRLTGSAAPVYPCYLPHANTSTTPFIGLCRASVEVFNDTFTAIETPAPPHAPPRGNNYSYIAQLYDALLDGLAAYPDQAALFQPNPDACQRLDIYLGKFGGKPVRVTDLASARLGVQQIVQQGEGSVPESQSMIPIEPWATYNTYGERTDGTYGPIIGSPYEMSHFKKFRTVSLDKAAFPPTYPIVSNPKRSDFTNPLAIQLVELFDIAYSLMLDSMERSFVAGQARDSFFTQGLPLMHQALPNLARKLMQTPLHKDTNGDVGPNGAPTYLYQPGSRLTDLAARLPAAVQVARQQIDDPAERDEMVDALESVRDNVGRLAAAHQTAQA